ncbi:MAG TPA: zf-HC2 domain-containing protein [Thermoanaerobaculia bacterium]|nr:zf-HC2 domain-containing protein [Thermoanaerobaculia bacterium]
MNGTDHTIYREWLDLEAEGALPTGDRRRLDAHLDACDDCRAERHRLASLHALLAESRVPVAPGFRQRVMTALPEPAWEARRASGGRWAWAGGLLAGLAALTALFFGLSGGRLAPGASVGGALAAVGDMLVTAAIAGAGLLGATWTGVGLAVSDLFQRSPGTAVAVALLAVFLAGLTVSLLRRPRAAERPVDRRR